jgi:hypothetical protein
MAVSYQATADALVCHVVDYEGIAATAIFWLNQEF